MNKKIILRKSPLLEFVFSDKHLVIKDLGEPSNNGSYLYDLIQSFEITETKSNWFLSILSFVVALLSGMVAGGFYKKKARLNFTYNDKPYKISLIDCESDKIQKVVQHAHKTKL
ncbi:hypothetical protein GO009_17245 [Muricauda sp. TY007]|uniref:hypothetical protein n=1 Tax=Allomuricauda sp. TY007 TaxID=2683200 RepID=UPI0013BF1A24|nr:hypothetical protein [Muricauda sp. TY007]NDV17760.1 hypothetical protein [Muricauda sp. TY007]